jgi:hypothetical protein
MKVKQIIKKEPKQIIIKKEPIQIIKKEQNIVGIYPGKIDDYGLPKLISRIKKDAENYLRKN